MILIDIHHHWVNETGYLDRLLALMDRVGVERLGLIAMGEVGKALFLGSAEPKGCVTNEDVARAVRRHRDRLFGYAFVRPGKDSVDAVDRARDKGLSALKFHVPTARYDDDRFLPLYARAEALHLPCLFHAGIFTPPHPMPEERISSAHCQPIYLDTLANAFPALKIIIAHMGICHGEISATLARIHSNVYLDLSGAATGWRSSKLSDWFREMLYWPDAWRKVLFGSDVHLSEYEEALASQLEVVNGLGWTLPQREAFLRGNAKAVYGA